MSDGLTIAKEYADKRARLVANLSPMARHQAFPGVYPRPLPPGEADTKAMRGEIERLRRQVEKLSKERAQLQSQVDMLIIKRSADSNLVAVANCDVIQRAFIEALSGLGYTINGDPYCLNHLFSKCRHEAYVRPRHVAIWVCIKLTRLSLPRIARAFQLADHTSARHGRIKAPMWMAFNPLLKAAAETTLAKFGVSE